MWRWEDLTTVACNNPTDFTAKTGTGADGCVMRDGEWQAMRAYVSQDQMRFRTLGEGVDEVAEENVLCLADDYYTVLEGRDNCWPYWLQGHDIGGVDQFLWLTRETIACENGVGMDECMLLAEIQCNSSKIGRLALNAD